MAWNIGMNKKMRTTMPPIEGVRFSITAEITVKIVAMINRLMASANAASERFETK